MLSCAPYPPVTCWSGSHHHWGGPFSGLLGLCALVLWVWVLVDVLRNETDEGSQRLIWGLVVGFTYVIGAVIYLIVRRPERMKTLSK
jgi:hypothetical protein